ncbi:alpha/beta fold hydrolase [Ornithinibacillus sp. L9]|uniref:Alpha/beta fold hydrolase n=1 Tax=Ornithinibacillus caprae TaxID=2678566 RepID=A0A6N8FLJ2_9BACI|nr:alpha/beta fold hydrolase [Ornithinibacillus caprae]MUK90512.1 alpha/beta fold hydrolase [Ornithinibacillus caprae]
MWEQLLVDTERGRFEVFVSGRGEPLCVTHLYSEFNELGSYFADMFTDSFRVYLVNLKEAGNSSKAKKNDELSMSETVNDLEAIREALDIKMWNFAGHSTGGMLGLVYGFNHPHSLNRLLVGGATATNEYMEHEDSIYSQKNQKNKRLKEIFSILKSSESTRTDRIKVSREWTEMSLYDPNRFDEYFSKPSSGRVVQKRLDYYSYEELPNYDIRDNITKIKTPTIVYCGKYDSQCPLVYSQQIHQLVPKSKLYVFEKSNHSPFREEKELFNELIKDYINLV